MTPFHWSKISLKKSALPLPFTLHLKTPTQLVHLEILRDLYGEKLRIFFIVGIYDGEKFKASFPLYCYIGELFKRQVVI